MTQSLIILGSDHAGYPLKEKCLAHLRETGYVCEDVGTHSTESCDYPEFAALACRKVLETGMPGLLICGTGLGMSMSANRFPGIRAALCFDEHMASMARRHNNANILCLGARIMEEDLAPAVVDSFLRTEFEGGRHEDRVRLMDELGDAPLSRARERV
ncbi:MAG: ribose 5-phosphate isomerase B [Desulfohalobiaceae bacterium]|nr:ribose 5-phosphate isomerase B [Desulfohalobiaceae bacterium]